MPDYANAGSVSTGDETNDLPQISGHTLLRCIGGGSYGRVYLAKNVIGRYRAVKIVARSAFSNEIPFEREFNGVQRYEPISRSHEGLVDILHVERDPQGKFFYYVMEIADDEQTGQETDPDNYHPKTLATILRQQGRLPISECIQIGLALTSALEHIHINGLVHRDIKPSNIIFQNGHPRFADIGLVTLATERQQSFVGTEGFVPPEGLGRPEADLYALGKVLYEMATGKDRCAFPDLPEDVDDIPDRNRFQALNQIMLKACDNQDRRYKTARQMRADFLGLERTGFVYPPRPQGRGFVWATAAMLAVVLGFFVYRLVFTIPNGTGGATPWGNAPRPLDDFNDAVSRGKDAYKNHAFTQALEEAERSLAIYPNDAAMQQLKADAQEQIDNQAACNAEVSNAWAVFDDGDFSNAWTMATAVLKKEPNEMDAAMLREMAKTNFDDYREAVKQAEDANKRGDIAAAEAYAYHALQIYPNDPAIREIEANARKK